MCLATLSRALRRSTAQPRQFFLALGVFCFAQATTLVLLSELRTLVPEPPLDYRPAGYSAEDVAPLLQAYGPQGRYAYLLLELLDAAIYAPAYAFLLGGLLSAAGAVAPFELLKWTNLLPCVAAAVDVVEDALVAALLLGSQRLPAEHSSALARSVAAASRAKWGLLYLTVCLLAGQGVFVLCVAAGLVGRRRRGAGAAASSEATQRQAGGARGGARRRR